MWPQRAKTWHTSVKAAAGHRFSRSRGWVKKILKERDRVGVGLALQAPEEPTDFIYKEFQTLRPLQPAGLPA